MVGGNRLLGLRELAAAAVRGRPAIRVMLTAFPASTELDFCARAGDRPVLWLEDAEVAGMVTHGYLARSDGGDHSVFREPCSVYEPTERMMSELRMVWAVGKLGEL